MKTRPEHEHPVVARIGIVAILVAMLLILWARIELYGTHDLEKALSNAPANGMTNRSKPSPDTDKARRKAAIDEAVATGRWAAGFSR